MQIRNILINMGVESERLLGILTPAITMALAVILAGLALLVVRRWLATIVMKIAGRTPTRWDDLMFDQRFFNRAGMLVAFIILRSAFGAIEWNYAFVFERILEVCITFSAVTLVQAVLDGGNRIYESYPVSRNRPIKVFIQVVMVFVYCAALIVVIQIFTGTTLTALLAGLTAFAAVLMLVFKDSILGFVAGIQLNANDMVRIGDWIVMPSSNADGDVLEINLTTVKVQNWDKTITTIPTYKLVSESFTNWRGMEESKGRRIKRSVNIDVNSIHYLSDEEIETLKSSVLLKDYIEEKVAEIADYNSKRGNRLDERRLTNIGTFREYMERWLAGNPYIHQGMTSMVRQLQPSPTGVPLEIYCFSARQKWVEYEKVQSDIFDHIFAVMEMFNLRAFQYSGTIVEGNH